MLAGLGPTWGILVVAVRILEATPLSGGAIQENWRLEAEADDGPAAGRSTLVLRTDSPAAVGASLSRGQEFALLKAAWQAGVAVPEPSTWILLGLGALGLAFWRKRR